MGKFGLSLRSFVGFLAVCFPTKIKDPEEKNLSQEKMCLVLEMAFLAAFCYNLRKILHVSWVGGHLKKNQKSEQTTRNPAACADVATGGVVG